MLIFNSVSLYGLVYAAGAVALCLACIKSRALPAPWAVRLSCASWLCCGAIIGARAGYVIFYGNSYYLSCPWDIIALYKGGMAFHGALAGLGIALLMCPRALRLPLADLCAVCALVFLPLGRICNFVYGELYGRVTSSAIGMVFEGGGPLPRLPVQLFEAAAEGPLLAAVLIILRHFGYLKAPGDTACAFSLGYAILRFFIEFWREPDEQLGLLALSLTMGQHLCLLQALATLVIWRLKTRRVRAQAAKFANTPPSCRTKPRHD